MCLGFHWCQKVVPKRYGKLLAETHRSYDLGKVALLALDAKVVTAARCCSKSAVNRLNSRGLNVKIYSI